MGVNLYRLYDVQSFSGVKVAIYVCEGNYPNAEILNDAEDVINSVRTRKEIMKDGRYNQTKTYPDEGTLNREKLTYFTRILKRSQKVLRENLHIGKAIFVNDLNRAGWRGERTLYANEYFDSTKADTPCFEGCKEIGTIII